MGLALETAAGTAPQQFMPGELPAPLQETAGERDPRLSESSVLANAT
jgi:hypothetical protein